MFEGAAFKSATPESVECQQIAPWIPPACRAQTTLNTELHKGQPIYIHDNKRNTENTCYKF